MYFFEKTNKNYYLYLILIFIFLPLNFLPPLFDGVVFDYSFEIGNITGLELWYKEFSRYVHLQIIYFVYFLSKYTQLSADIFIDNLTIIFLILFCLEIKKYSKFLFHLDDKWCNFAALFTAIFPVWHILVAFDINLYLISIYFLLFGYRNFIKKKKINIFIGVIFIILSFDLESNISFVVGLAIIQTLLNKKDNKNFFPTSKLIAIFFICITYYLLKQLYFPPSGSWEGYNAVPWKNFGANLFEKNFVLNIFNYSTYFLLYLWIPILFILNLLFINRNLFREIKLDFKKIFSFKNISDYLLLVLLSGFAIFPYILLNKSSSIFFLSDYFQRHALLLAPIFGMFFSLVFRDLSKINCLQYKVNINFYLITFICINLILLNYGTYRKIESYTYRINLIKEFKNYGSIPKGNVLIIGKHIPADLRYYELNQVLYKAYGTASWWVIPYHPAASNEPEDPPPLILSDERRLIQYVSSDYEYECRFYVYLVNDLKKIERIKKFYIFNYKKYYNIDKIVKKC